MHIHSHNAISRNVDGVMCDIIPTDVTSSMVFDNEPQLTMNDVVTVFSPTLYGKMNRLSFHTLSLCHLLLQCRQPSTILKVVEHSLLVFDYLINVLSLLPLTMLQLWCSFLG